MTLPDPNEIARQSMLAVAAWTELEAAIKMAEAAALRGDKEGQEAARQRAHDLLDAHLDLKTQLMMGLSQLRLRP